MISTVPFLWWVFRPTTPLSGVLVSMIGLAFGVALILVALVSESSSPGQ